MKILSLIAISLVSTTLFAQNPASQNTKAQPVGGKGALQIVYYRIDFTKEETEYLRTHTPELIFSVSEYGKAKLEKVNDIDQQSIIDSLMNVNDRLPDFYAERVNGRAEQGIYFLKLTWPNYQNGFTTNNSSNGIQYYYPVIRKLTDYEQITYRGARFDMLIGGFMAGFGGNIGKNLDTGWGTKFDFMIYGKHGWGGGFGTTLVIAKEKLLDPSIPIRQQFRSHLITMFTGSVGKIIGAEGRSQLAIQFEPGFGLTDASLSTQSNHAVSMGFVPGAAVHYLLPLGKGRMGRHYFLPIAYRNFLSVHVAARQLMFNVEESRGTVYELGLSWRFAQRGVMDYKLKDSVN